MTEKYHQPCDDNPDRHRPFSRWYCAACGKEFRYKQRVFLDSEVGEFPACPNKECGSGDIFPNCKIEDKENKAECAESLAAERSREINEYEV